MGLDREEKIRQVNERLAKWRGAHAQLWSYTAAHATLEVRLFFPHRPGNLYLVCSPCESIAGPVYWEPCDLTAADDQAEEDLFVVQDQRSCVCLRCRQLDVVENAELRLPSGGA